MDSLRQPAPNRPQFGLFRDKIVSSTRLQRETGDVLDTARTQPVTISRNGELFALMPRDQAAGLVLAGAALNEIIEIFHQLNLCQTGEPPGEDYAWLRSFDEEELSAMRREVVSAARRAAASPVEGDDWSSVGHIIHAWRESGLAIGSGVLDLSPRADDDPAPLPSPSEYESRRE